MYLAHDVAVSLSLSLWHCLRLYQSLLRALLMVSLSLSFTSVLVSHVFLSVYTLTHSLPLVLVVMM